MINNEHNTNNTEQNSPSIDTLNPTTGAGLNLATDAEAEAPQRKPSNSATNATVFFLVLVVAAAAVVITMRQIGFAPVSALAGDVRIDYDIHAQDRDNDNTDRILSELSGTRTEQQVPIDKVQKNPFKLSDSFTIQDDETQADSETPAQAIFDRLRRQAEQRKREIQTALNDLELQMIIGQVARVNGELVREGDRLGLFTVTRVNRRSVELEADDETYTLEIPSADLGR